MSCHKPDHPTILVTSATGNIGSEVVNALSKHGVHFRAAVHSKSKAEHLEKLKHVEIVEMDWYNPASVEAAVRGIKKAFLGLPPGQTEGPSKIFADACKKEGVTHIVKLSALGGEAEPGQFVWAEEHVHAEEYIKSLGIHLTAIRPSFFMANWMWDVQTIKEKSTIFRALGDAKINMIANSDVGEAIYVCLHKSGHEDKVYNLTGPDTLTVSEIAHIFSELLGREIKYVPLSDEQLREQSGHFMPPPAVEGNSNMHKYFRDGGYNKHFNDLHHLICKNGEHSKDWIKHHLAAFK